MRGLCPEMGIRFFRESLIERLLTLFPLLIIVSNSIIFQNRICLMFTGIIKGVSIDYHVNADPLKVYASRQACNGLCVT